MRLRRARLLIALLPLPLAGCDAQTTGVGSREPLAEEHTGYRLEYVAADRAVAQSLVSMIESGRKRLRRHRDVGRLLQGERWITNASLESEGVTA